ncbi:hypothetical protein T07_11512 [Trichinella nelsoni]|uniref:Uncharacterized protein n=1 Tax=Trichinella nelsoni TaxID=6336 RepID=A0A0V0RJB4_9BILA|nr:hypothetical protein T07_11512 [Trichinella nelsoni]
MLPISDNEDIAHSFFNRWHQLCRHKWIYVYDGRNKSLHSISKVTLLIGRRYADPLSNELNRRASSTPFKDQKQEKLHGCSGKVWMARNRLAAAVFSSSPEMDERNAADMKALSRKRSTKLWPCIQIDVGSPFRRNLFSCKGAPNMQMLFPFTNCQRCRIRQWDCYFQTNRSAMKHREKPLVSKKRSKSKEAPYGILEK